MGSAFQYRHSGECIASHFVLPEWGSGVAKCEATVRIELRDPRPGIEPAPDHFDDASQTLSFTQQGVGRWSISEGAKIRVEPCETAAAEELRLYTLGSAWGALGYQRGWAMWHGSGVETGGRAALFCGDSGRGKSTMAAAMVARGHRLIADDLSRVSPEDCAIWPSASRVKLWAGALAAFGYEGATLQRDHFEDERYHMPIENIAPCDRPVPIGGIFVLQWGAEPALERLRGSDAVRALSEEVMYRKEFLELMGRLGEHVVGCAQVAAKVPVWRLTRRRDFAAIDSTCRSIEEAIKER